MLSLGLLLWPRKSVLTEHIAIDVRASMDFASSEATGSEFRAMPVVQPIMKSRPLIKVEGSIYHSQRFVRIW
jgi:hypothetical protein